MRIFHGTDLATAHTEADMTATLASARQIVAEGQRWYSDHKRIIFTRMPIFIGGWHE